MTINITDEMRENIELSGRLSPISENNTKVKSGFFREELSGQYLGSNPVGSKEPEKYLSDLLLNDIINDALDINGTYRSKIKLNSLYRKRRDMYSMAFERIGVELEIISGIKIQI